MAYRRPAIEVIEEFQSAAVSLGLPTLPACIVGPGYQIVDGANAGIYVGAQKLFAYPGLAAGAVVDLSAPPTAEAEANVHKPVGVSLKNAYLVKKDNGAGAAITTGKVDTANQGKSVFKDLTANAFASFDPSAVGAPSYYVNLEGPVRAKATGTLVAKAKADLVDGKIFTLNDGVNPAKVFEYDVAGDGVQGGRVAVNISASTTDVTVAAVMRAAIAGAGLNFAVTADVDNTVRLTNTGYGAVGNVAITTDAGITVTGMSGGVDGIDVADKGKHLIVKKTDANTLQVAGEFQTATVVANAQYRILVFRSAEVYPFSTFAANGITLAASGVTIPIALKSYTDVLEVLETDILLSWRAIRPDLAGALNVFTDIDSLKAIFGVSAIVPSNIGAYAVNLALQNTVTPVNYTGLGADFQTDEETSFTTALSYLESKDVYALAILTHNPAVHQTAKTHVNLMSVSTVGRERVCFISRRLSTYAVMTPASGLGYSTGGAATGAAYKTFRDTDSTFITDAVGVGHFVEMTEVTVGNGVLTAPQLAYLKTTRHKIATVDSQLQVTLASDPTNGGVANLTLTAITYRITRDLTRAQEASFLAGYASSFASRRVVSTWPDVLAVSVNAVKTKVPGYLAGAVLAGMTAGLPSQAGFTNLTMTGFVGRENSDDRYTDTLLDTIAGGGNMVLTQPVPETALLIRHQLTTDLSTIYFQEFSVTKNVDLLARFFRGLYAPFVGPYNIYDGLLDLMKTRAESGGQFLLSQRVARVGAPVRKISLSRIEESKILPDTVEIDVKADVPLPLNNIKFTLMV